MKPPPLLDFDTAIADPLQRYDELLARKAEYTLSLIDKSETLEGEARAKALRTIAALEAEIAVLNEMYTTLDNLRKYYDEQLSYFWIERVRDAERIEFLNQQYLSALEYSKIIHEIIERKLAK